MSNEPEVPLPRIANVVGIRANSNGAPLAPVRTRYTGDWKECCARILREYRSRLSDKLMLSVGWGRIRNEIMREFDSYEDRRLVGEDSRLRRQDLEHWLDGGKEIGDEKFRFVDYFVHGQLLDGRAELSFAAKSVISHQETEQMRAFRLLYLGGSRALPPEIADVCGQFEGRLHVVDVKPPQDSVRVVNGLPPNAMRTALFVRPSSEAAFSVTAFYYDRALTSAEDIIEQGYRYFGYLLPVSLLDQTGEPISGGKTVYGVLTLFDRALLATQQGMFHVSSHCFLHSNSQESPQTRFLVTDVLRVTRPYWYANDDAEGLSARELLAQTRELDAPVYLGRFDKLEHVALSQAQRELLTNLQDEYLIW